MQILSQMLTDQYTNAHFEALLQIIDRLHDAAAAGDLNQVSPLSTHEVISRLDDIIFTAEEAQYELQEMNGANKLND